MYYGALLSFEFSFLDDCVPKERFCQAVDAVRSTFYVSLLPILDFRNIVHKLSQFYCVTTYVVLLLLLTASEHDKF